MSALLVLVSCPADRAEGLARDLVEARLAACVNLLPGAVSIYRWREAVEREAETLLLIKTTTASFEDLRQGVLSRHPYELPEVIAVDVSRGHLPYLEWLAQCCAAPPPPSLAP